MADSSLYQARGKNDLSDVFLQHRAVIHELLHRHSMVLRSPQKQSRLSSFSGPPSKFPLLLNESIDKHDRFGDGNRRRLLLLENGGTNDTSTSSGRRAKDWRRTESIRKLNEWADSDFMVYATLGNKNSKEEEIVLDKPCLSNGRDVFYDSIVSNDSIKGDDYDDSENNSVQSNIRDDFFDCEEYDCFDSFADTPPGMGIQLENADVDSAGGGNEEFSESSTTSSTFPPPDRNNCLETPDAAKVELNESTDSISGGSAGQSAVLFAPSGRHDHDKPTHDESLESRRTFSKVEKSPQKMIHPIPIQSSNNRTEIPRLDDYSSDKPDRLVTASSEYDIMQMQGSIPKDRTTSPASCGHSAVEVESPNDLITAASIAERPEQGNGIFGLLPVPQSKMTSHEHDNKVEFAEGDSTSRAISSPGVFPSEDCEKPLHLTSFAQEQELAADHDGSPAGAYSDDRTNTQQLDHDTIVTLEKQSVSIQKGAHISQPQQLRHGKTMTPDDKQSCLEMRTYTDNSICEEEDSVLQSLGTGSVAPLLLNGRADEDQQSESLQVAEDASNKNSSVTLYENHASDLIIEAIECQPSGVYAKESLQVAEDSLDDIPNKEQTGNLASARNEVIESQPSGVFAEESLQVAEVSLDDIPSNEKLGNLASARIEAIESQPSGVYAKESLHVAENDGSDDSSSTKELDDQSSALDEAVASQPSGVYIQESLQVAEAALDEKPKKPTPDENDASAFAGANKEQALFEANDVGYDNVAHRQYESSCTNIHIGESPREEDTEISTAMVKSATEIIPDLVPTNNRTAVAVDIISNNEAITTETSFLNHGAAGYPLTDLSTEVPDVVVSALDQAASMEPEFQQTQIEITADPSSREEATLDSTDEFQAFFSDDYTDDLAMRPTEVADRCSTNPPSVGNTDWSTHDINHDRCSSFSGLATGVTRPTESRAGCETLEAALDGFGAQVSNSSSGGASRQFETALTPSPSTPGNAKPQVGMLKNVANDTNSNNQGATATSDEDLKQLERAETMISALLRTGVCVYNDGIVPSEMVLDNTAKPSWDMSAGGLLSDSRGDGNLNSFPDLPVGTHNDVADGFNSSNRRAGSAVDEDFSNSEGVRTDSKIASPAEMVPDLVPSGDWVSNQVRPDGLVSHDVEGGGLAESHVGIHTDDFKVNNANSNYRRASSTPAEEISHYSGDIQIDNQQPDVPADLLQTGIKALSEMVADTDTSPDSAVGHVSASTAPGQPPVVFNDVCDVNANSQQEDSGDKLGSEVPKASEFLCIGVNTPSVTADDTACVSQDLISDGLTRSVSSPRNSFGNPSVDIDEEGADEYKSNNRGATFTPTRYAELSRSAERKIDTSPSAHPEKMAADMLYIGVPVSNVGDVPSEMAPDNAASASQDKVTVSGSVPPKEGVTGTSILALGEDSRADEFSPEFADNPVVASSFCVDVDRTSLGSPSTNPVSSFPNTSLSTDVDGPVREVDNQANECNGTLLLNSLGNVNPPCRSPVPSQELDSTAPSPRMQSNILDGNDSQEVLPSVEQLENKWNQCADMWGKLTVEKAFEDGKLGVASDISSLGSGSLVEIHDAPEFNVSLPEDNLFHQDNLQCSDRMGAGPMNDPGPSRTPPREWRSTFSTPGRSNGGTPQVNGHRVETATGSKRVGRSPFSTPGRSDDNGGTTTTSPRSKVQAKSPHRVESANRSKREWRSPLSTPGRSDESTSTTRTSPRAKVQAKSPHRIEFAMCSSRMNQRQCTPSSSFNAPALRTSERAKQRRHNRDSLSSPHKVLSSRPQYTPSSSSPGRGLSPPPTVERVEQQSHNRSVPSTYDRGMSSRQYVSPPPSVVRFPPLQAASIKSSASKTEAIPATTLPLQKSRNRSEDLEDLGAENSIHRTQVGSNSKNVDVARQRTSRRRPQENREPNNVCTKSFNSSKHKTMGACFRCWSNASGAEQSKFLARGSHLCIVKTKGGCDDDSCPLFPSVAGEPVRLCRKCFCATHAKSERLQVYRGNHVKVVPIG